MKAVHLFPVATGAISLALLTVTLPTVLQAQEAAVQIYQCSPSEKIVVKPIPGSQPLTLEVTLPDGRAVMLPQAESASGAKFSNGSITFWSKGNTALVEEEGELQWQDCVKLPSI
jgi:membrane-bound inhibitor of C-type lysozyme